MISPTIRAKNVDQNAKKWKRPPKSSKNKMFIFGLHSTSDDRPSDPSNVDRNAKKQKRAKNKMLTNFWKAEQSEQKTLTKMQKNEKGPLSHQKIKCSFLDYVQLLMIGQAIWAKNVDQNTKKWKRPPKSSKNKMFIFGLCSTSDDRPSNPSKKCWPKHKKMKKAP